MNLITNIRRVLRHSFCLAAFSIAVLTLPLTASGQQTTPPTPSYATADPLGVAMEGWAHPYPLQTLQFEQDGQPLRMMYMDVPSAKPTGQTVPLMHGKNFGADY